MSPKEVPLAPGLVTLRVVNRGNTPMGFMALEVDWEGLNKILASHPSRMRPFLTAKMLLNSQTFRDLFRVQTLDANMRLRLRSLTLLFTDLKGSTRACTTAPGTSGRTVLCRNISRSSPTR